MPTRPQPKRSVSLNPLLVAGSALLCMGAASVAAQPVFSGVVAIQGVKLYPDSESADIYYFAPGGVELKRIDGVPAFSFIRYRYVGTRSSGDAGEFRAKALLSFTVRLVSEPSSLPAARSQLNGILGRTVQLLALPIDTVEAELVYTAAGTSTERQSGTLGAGYWSDPADPETGEVWTERTFYVSADPQSADLLWQTYHRGAVILSLNVSVRAKGSKEKPGQGLGAGQTVAKTVMADALKVSVSPKRHPELFRDVDLNEKIPADYPFLDVYCYDFQNEKRPDDLVAVDVIVRGSAAAARKPVEERIRFVPEHPEIYKRQVRFQFAMDLDSGYAYRVVRTYGSGGKAVSDWKQVSYWNGICDVTSGDGAGAGVKDARPLDARMLY